VIYYLCLKIFYLDYKNFLDNALLSSKQKRLTEINTGTSLQAIEVVPEYFV